MNFASKAERLAAPILAAQPAPSKPCQSFSDAGLSDSYMDAANESCDGKPDFLCVQAHSFTLLELKDGDLNFHVTHESSRAALQSEYEAMTGRAYVESLPHSKMSGALFDAGHHRACLDHGFNHSLWKLLALQAAHGWQRYVAVFVKTPPKRLAMQYLAAGLVFCTLDTLPDMLRTIELCQHGFFVPFIFISKRAKYWYSVTPDHTDHGKPAEAILASDRAKFEAAAAASLAEAQSQDAF
jgi:hypothetical protein